MATTAGTSPTDVSSIIDTDLSDAEINSFLDDAEWEVADANDTDAMDTVDIVQLEKYLAALHIREWYERAVSKDSVGDSSITFEGPSLERLERAVDKRDPSGTLADSGQANWTATTADVTD